MEVRASHARRRRWLIAAIAVLALGVVAWQLLERAADVDRYRPQVVEELTRVTGMPVSVGHLDLAWRPIPCLSALDISIGEGDLQVTTARVDVFPALHALLWRHIRISRISLDELVVTLPETPDEMRRAWRETSAQLESAFAGRDAEAGTGWSVEVSGVHAEEAALRLGADGPTVAVVHVTASGVSSDELELELEAELPDTGGRAEGTLFVPLGGDASEKARGGIRGAFDVSALRPGRFFALPGFLRAIWQGRVVVASEAAGGIRLDLEGEFEPVEEGVLGGTFTGHALAGGDAPTTGRFDAQGEGLSMRASAEIGEATEVRVEELSVRGAVLESILAQAAAEPLRVEVAPESGLEARALTLGIGPGGWPRLDSGTIEVRGIDVSWKEETLADDVRVDARLAEGAIEIAELQGGPLALRGRIAHDDEWRRFDLALSGSLHLADAWLHAVGVPEAVQDARGVIRIEGLEGTLPPAPDRDPLTVRAELAGGSLRVAAGEVEDAISDLALRATNRERRVFVEASGRSRLLGEMSVSATLDPDERTAHGNVAIDAAALAAYVEDPGVRTRVEPILRSYARSRIGFRIGPTSADAYELVMERLEAPRLDATVALRTGEADVLGDIEATAELTGDGMVGLLPEGARASGSAQLALRRSAAERTYQLRADLVRLGLATGAYLEKKVGEALTLQVEGGGGEEDGAGDWTPRRLEVSSPSATASFGLADGGLVAPDLDLDLADWSFLLVDGARASGRVRGSLDTPAKAVELALSEVGLHLSDDVGVDAIDGAIRLEGEDWRVADLRIRGAMSDATLDATLSGGHLEGRLTGASLDLDFVRTLLGEVEAIRSDDAPDEASPPISGTLAVQLERVGYGRGEARNVRANASLRDGDVSVSDLALDTYEGHVSGTMEVARREDAPSQLTLTLDFADVTGRFLDDVFLEPPRDVSGRFSGALHFDAPLHDDAKAMFAEASGTLSIEGREGSLGRLGLATRLVTVLRSTEALRAKLPSLRDEGLVFDVAALELVMERGRAELESLDIDSHSYAVDATGHLDFREEKSKVPIEVNVIKGLSGVVSWIPVAGSALEIVNVRLVATGSPWDLQVRVASFTDQVLGAGRAGAGAVIRDANDALRLLRGAMGGGGASPEAPDEPEAATSEPAPGEAAQPASPDASAEPAADAPESEAPPPDAPESEAPPPDDSDPSASPDPAPQPEPEEADDAPERSPGAAP